MAHADAFGYRRLSINFPSDYVAFAGEVRAQSPQRWEDDVANDDMSARIASLKSDLEDIEAAFEQSSADEASLKELKSTVDNIRLTVWAVLTAAQADDKTAANQVVARFRARRATELLWNVLRDVRSEALPIDSPELGTFRETIGGVVTRLEALDPTA